MENNNKPTTQWKRSKYTSGLVGRIRSVILKAGYSEECAVVPLFDTFSVLVKKDNSIFNLKMSKTDLSIIKTTPILYRIKKGRIQSIVRATSN